MENDWLDGILDNNEIPIDDDDLRAEWWANMKAAILKHFKELPSLQMEELTDEEPLTYLVSERNKVRQQVIKELGGLNNG